MEEEELLEALVEVMTDSIEDQVAAGTITDEQSEQQLDILAERLTKLI